MKRTAAVVVGTALIVTALLPALAAAAGSTATVNVTVSPRTQVTRVDDALVVRSNTAWRVVVMTRGDVNEYVGGKTNGERLEIPDNTTDYWVVAE